MDKVFSCYTKIADFSSNEDGETYEMEIAVKSFVVQKRSTQKALDQHIFDPISINTDRRDDL